MPKSQVAPIHEVETTSNILAQRITAACMSRMQEAQHLCWKFLPEFVCDAGFGHYYYAEENENNKARTQSIQSLPSI